MFQGLFKVYAYIAWIEISLTIEYQQPILPGIKVVRIVPSKSIDVFEPVSDTRSLLLQQNQSEVKYDLKNDSSQSDKLSFFRNVPHAYGLNNNVLNKNNRYIIRSNDFISTLKQNIVTETYLRLEEPNEEDSLTNKKYLDLNVPDFSILYDKLAQIKLSQNYINNQKSQVTESNYKNQPNRAILPVILPPYRPVPIGATKYIQNQPVLKYDRIRSQSTYDLIHPTQLVYEYQPEQTNSQEKNRYNRPGQNIDFNPEFEQVNIIEKPRPISLPIVEESYVAQNYVPTKYQKQVFETHPKPVNNIPENVNLQKPHIIVNTENQQPFYTKSTNALRIILKQLQDSNTLPQTLTSENIDNSIKTLVKILNFMKKKQKFAKPIYVLSESIENSDNSSGSQEDFEIPDGLTVQNQFDENDNSGTPGEAGVDYPALSNIPPTNFNCQAQRYKGFFGDPDTNCQVWHYCDLNGGQASFLCPNGTIFSQVALTCDWWYNVKCSSTPQLYVLNERLYKYILPLSPKFPEDYSGPLVDKYLALKFKEMEAKIKNKKTEHTSESMIDESTQEKTTTKVENLSETTEINEKD